MVWGEVWESLAHQLLTIQPSNCCSPAIATEWVDKVVRLGPAAGCVLISLLCEAVLGVGPGGFGETLAVCSPAIAWNSDTLSG